MLTVERLAVARGGRRVLSDVSLSLAAGEALFVLGESGAGKSTLLRALLGLAPPAAGRAAIDGRPVTPPRPGAPAPAQVVMQDPIAALSPWMSLEESVAEPLRARGMRRAEALAEARAATARMGLDPALLTRRPAGVSLGQAQRACVARALIARPRLLLCDEPLSALDAPAQRRVAALIDAARRERGAACLVVTHDLGYAAAHADRVAVLRAGRVVETGPAAGFFAAPASDYGRALRDAASALGALASREAA
jgi:peptide/nickel transport system ATP-binding protein